jgi:hypothetical protein
MFIFFDQEVVIENDENNCIFYRGVTDKNSVDNVRFRPEAEVTIPESSHSTPTK